MIFSIILPVLISPLVYISNSIPVPPPNLLLSSMSPASEVEEQTQITTPITEYGDDDVNSKALKSEILHHIFTERKYDPNIRPQGENGTGPTVVRVQVALRSVENVDDVRMQYSVQMVFRQQWIDPRLSFEHYEHNVQYLQLDKSHEIWMPDIFFKNEKSGYMHHLIVPNQFTRLHPNGKVLQSYRISLVLSCIMDLRAYPLDVQDCPIVIESYGWTTNNLVLQWRNDTPVNVARDFSTSRFHSEGFHTTRDKITSSTGSYSRLRLHIKFAREFGFYLIQIYLPCSMLVIVSWVSFWLEPTAVEARVSLGVTTILTIVTQTYGINQSAPPASYAKALDIWTAWCQGMVFGALLEFASVNYLCHKQKLKAKKLIQEQKELVTKEEQQIAEEKFLSTGIKHAKRIDRGSRIIFPIVYVMFNIFYWYNYLVFHRLQ